MASLDPDKVKRPALARTRLAVLLGAPLTEVHFERLGISKLAAHFDVLVIDCMRLAGRDPDHVKSHKVTWPSYVTAATADELREALERFKPRYAFDDIGLSPQTAVIGWIVRQCGVKLVSVRDGRLPVPSLKDRIRLMLSWSPVSARGEASAPMSTTIEPHSRMLVHRVLRALNRVSERVKYEYRRRTKVVVPDVVLLAGTRSLDTQARFARHRVWIGSNDYYEFQRVVTGIRAGAVERRKAPYALFIDVCLPFAADWQLLQERSPIDPAQYYSQLRALFDRVERLSDMPVVVAGHPNSRSLPDYPTLLGGRELVFGQTSALVLQSKLVLTHASTANSYIALAAKPALFVSSKAINEIYYGIFVRSMAKSLNSPMVMMEDAASLDETMLKRPADEGASRRYVERYLRAPRATEKSPWQEFITFLLSEQQRSTND